MTWGGGSLPRRSLGTKVGVRPAGGVGWPSSPPTLPTLPRQSQTPDGQGPAPRGPLWGGRAPAAAGALGSYFLGRGTQTLKSPGLPGCLDESWARAQELRWPPLRVTGPERRGLQGRVRREGLACPFHPTCACLPGAGRRAGVGEAEEPGTECCGVAALGPAAAKDQRCSARLGRGCQGRGAGAG